MKRCISPHKLMLLLVFLLPLRLWAESNPSAAPLDPQPSSQPAPIFAPGPRPVYTLTAALSADQETISGELTIVFQNTSRQALSEALLWLYPNRFEERPDYLNELNQPSHYPKNFDPASMTLLSASVDGKSVTPRYEAGPEGKRLFAALPLVLAPQASATLSLQFETKIPLRYGRYGRALSTVVLDGGFYPALASLSETGFRRDTPPRPVDGTARIRHTGGISFLNGSGPFEGEASVSLQNAPYVSWVWLKDARLREGCTDESIVGLDPQGCQKASVRYFYTDSLAKDRSGSFWEEGPAGLGSNVARDYPSEVVEATVAGLRFLESLGDTLLQKQQILLIEVPLRERVAVAAPGMVLVSDRAMKVSPIESILKFHVLQVLRSTYALLVEEKVRGFEREEDLAWASDALGAYLSDLYHYKAYLKQDFAKELLKPYSFIAEIDRLRWLPQVAFKNAYFHTAYEQDLFRDDIRRFGSEAPFGKFVYGKLRDLIGMDRFALLARSYLGGDKLSFRELSARIYEAPLGWFYAQWMGKHPAINYTLKGFASESLPAGGYRLSVEVEKSGDTWVQEPVEVLAIDKQGKSTVLSWPMDATSHRFTWEGPAPLKRVHIDPRERTYEYEEGNPLDLKLDNQTPARWRIVSDGFTADASSAGIGFLTSASARKAHDKKNFYFTGVSLSTGLLAGFDDKALRLNDTQSFFLGYSRAFGVGLDEDRLTARLGTTGVFAHLGPRLSDANEDGTLEFVPPALLQRLTVSLGYSNRLSFLSPWQGTSLGVAASYVAGETLTEAAPVFDGQTLLVNDSCGSLCQSLALSFGATRLISLDGGKVLGLRLSTATLLGTPLGQSFFDLGGGSGLKGYPINEVEGRTRLLGAAEFRLPLWQHQDVNIFELTRFRALQSVFWLAAATLSGTGFEDEPRTLFGEGSLFSEVGAGLRFFGDHLGVDPAMFSLDVAMPLQENEWFGGAFPALQFYLGFEQNF